MVQDVVKNKTFPIYPMNGRIYFFRGLSKSVKISVNKP